MPTDLVLRHGDEDDARVEALPASLRVLYVEDCAVNARLMAHVFTRFRPDLCLDIATDGRSGLQMLEILHPDMVLLDYHLPDTNGLVWLKAIRAAGNQVPVSVVTADARPELAAAVTAAGGDETLTKPFDIGTLLDLVARQLPLVAAAR